MYLYSNAFFFYFFFFSWSVVINADGRICKWIVSRTVGGHFHSRLTLVRVSQKHASRLGHNARTPWGLVHIHEPRDVWTRLAGSSLNVNFADALENTSWILAIRERFLTFVTRLSKRHVAGISFILLCSNSAINREDEEERPPLVLHCTAFLKLLAIVVVDVLA